MGSGVIVVKGGSRSIDTTGDFLSQQGVRERIAAMTPLGRLGLPDDIAEAAAWLISPAAAFVTGSLLTVSGGR